MRRRSMSILLLLLCCSIVVAQNQPDKTNEFRIGLKTGRTLYNNPEELGGRSGHVFYGQVALDYGVCRNKSVYYGAGIGVEFIDMLDAEFSFPVHLELRYYFIGDQQKGAFVDVQAGYTFCGQQTFPIIISELGEMPVGQIVRKMAGPFGEISLGYRTSRFDFFIAFDYRVTHYLENYQYHNSYYNLESTSFFKPLHSFMAGVSYKIL